MAHDAQQPIEVCRARNATTTLGPRYGVIVGSLDNQTGSQAEQAISAAGVYYTRAFRIEGPNPMVFLRLLRGTAGLTSVQLFMVVFGPDGNEVQSSQVQINAANQIGSVINTTQIMTGRSYGLSYANAVSAGANVLWQTPVFSADVTCCFPIDLSSAAGAAGGFGSGSILVGRWARFGFNTVGTAANDTAIDIGIGFSSQT